MTPEQRDPLREALREITDQLCLAVDGRVDFTVRTRVADPDAEKLVMLINFLLDSAGRLIERLEDQTRELDQRVSERSSQLKATYETLLDGLIVIDEGGVILDTNPAARQLLHAGRDIVGRNISEFMPEPHRSAHDGYLQRYLHSGERRIIGKSRELEAIGENGRRFPVRLAVSEVEVEGQRRFVGLLRDISEDRAQQEALEHERQFVGRLFDAVPDVIYAFDTQMRFLRWNQAILDVVDMDAEQFARSRVPQHVAVRDWPRVLKAIQEVFTKGKSQVTARLKTKGGRLVPYEFAAARLTDAQGKLLGLVGSGRSIEEREAYQMNLIEARESAEQAQRKAEEASLAKSRFLAGMSHELRTPLNAIIGYSELILEELEDGAPPEQSRNDLLAIRDAGRHLLGLINNVLDLSRIEAGHTRFQPEELHPGDLAHAVATTAKPLIERNGSRLELDFAAELPTMFSDSGKLRQCLLNLLGNAAKFTENGTVRLSVISRRTEDGANEIVWEVADTGIGMNAQELERIFDAFAQADDSINRRYGGTGLGLPLTQQLIRVLGGRIEVESQPGAGSTFRLILPQEPPPADDAHEASAR
jgi:PAS domain S-box-containing protein